MCHAQIFRQQASLDQYGPRYLPSKASENYSSWESMYGICYVSLRSYTENFEENCDVMLSSNPIIVCEN